MNEKRFFAGLTALVLSIGFVLTGCESPTAGDAGGPGAAGVNAPNVVGTLAGIKAAFADGYDIVYLVQPLTLEEGIALIGGKTLVIATTGDIGARSAGSGTGSLTIGTGGALAVAGTLKVNAGTALTVSTGTLTVAGALELEGTAALTIAAAGTLVAIASAELVIPATATLDIKPNAGIALDPGVNVTGVDASFDTIIADAEAASPVKYGTVAGTALDIFIESQNTDYENIVAHRWRLTNERPDYHCRPPLAADK